ncbi:MAG: B12-binding domain-containing protein, partial [Anaerolineales bacterium]
MSNEEKIQAVNQAVLNGAMAKTAELVQEAIDANIGANSILQDGLIAAMGEVGRLIESGECYVPEMLISAKS